MLKDPMSTGQREEQARRRPGAGRGSRRDAPRGEEPVAREARQGPDPRLVALRVLSAFLKAGAEPSKGRTPMPAPPRHPAGGAGFPRPGRAAPPVVATSPPPQVPFPALAAAAAGYARPSAMEAIGRFVEAARAGGLADWRRRRGAA